MTAEMKARQSTTATAFLILGAIVVLLAAMYVGSYFVWVQPRAEVGHGWQSMRPTYPHPIKKPLTRAVAVSRFIRSVYEPIHYVDAKYLRTGLWRESRRIDPDSVGGRRHLDTAPRVD